MKQTSIRRPRSLRQHPATIVNPTVLKAGMALSLGTAILAPMGVMAQKPAPAQEEVLPEVRVKTKALDPNPNAEVGVPYKARTSADNRHTRPLAETPQTISVVTKAAIEDSGLTDLKQILDAQPGITLGTGENGNAFGDRYIIRGQEARSDVFVDGLRDPGMTTRESFATEQLEISKGPNSSFAGRGTTGGAINAITKQATLDMDFNRISAAVGTDKHVRLTADVNKGFTDEFALRANVLWGDENVPDRAPSSRKRQGLALSGLYEINPDLSVTLDYYGLRARDKYPDLGAFLVGTVPNRVPATNVPVYAQDSDFLKSDVDTVTARVKYQVSANTSINSLTRYGQSKNAYVTTGASFGARDYTAGGSSTGVMYLDGGHHGWQDVSYFAHQTNVRMDREVGGTKHELIISAEFTDHKVVSGPYNLNNSNMNCGTSTRPGSSYCVYDASGNPLYTGSLNSAIARNVVQLGKNQEWHARTLALSAMDTVDLTDKTTLFGGVRFDQLNLTLNRFSTTDGSQTAHYNYEKTLLNGHLGMNYKIAPQGIVYASWASSQDVNGGEPDSGTSSGYGGLVVNSAGQVGSEPETTVNHEIGTKWNLMDDKLLLTAAVFEMKKSSVMEGANYDVAGTFNTGANKVHGVEFSLTGEVTDKFTLQAGVAIMKSKVTKSFTAANVGRELANFANRSVSVQGKYDLTSAWSIGAAARYESKRCGGQPDTAVGYTNGTCSQPVPAYTVYDVFGAYRFSRKLDVRLNVLNVTNKDYYTAVYRSGSFLYKGDARAVRMTVNYEF